MMWPRWKILKLLEHLNGLIGTARQNIEVADIIRASHSISGKKKKPNSSCKRKLTGPQVTLKIPGFLRTAGEKWKEGPVNVQLLL